MTDVLYDCYDKNERQIGIIFAKNCKDLLDKNSNVKYVRGIDYITRKPQWFEVKEDGLHQYQPKNKIHKEENDWYYFDFI